MDDHHTLSFIMVAPPPTTEFFAALKEGKSVGKGRGRSPQLRGGDWEEQHPPSTDWYGRFRLVADADDDYQLDRNLRRAGGSYTGMPSAFIEDQAVTESMGPLYDRTQEHLGTSDAMIIRTRHRLLAAADALAKEGIVPPGVDDPDVYRQRAGCVMLSNEDSDRWFEATESQRAAFVEYSPEEIRASYVRS